MFDSIKPERKTATPNNTMTYMFKDKPVHCDTWLKLHADPNIQTLRIRGYIWMLLNPSELTYCYVYADEAQQFSNPFETFNAAQQACDAYADWLATGSMRK